MGTSRFGFNNLLTTLPVTIANGTGGGPARSEVAPYVMERAMDGERSTLWQPGAQNQDSGTTWEIVFDFGTPVFITMMAARGVEGILSTVTAGVYTTYPTTKNSSTLVHNGRDWGATFAQKSGQYPFFKFAGSALDSVGDFFLGLNFDAAVVGLPGFETTPYRIRTEDTQLDGSTVLNDTGRLGHSFEMSFLAKDVTAVANFEQLIGVAGTVIHIDERDRTFEVLIREGKLPTRRELARRVVTLSMLRQP